VPLAGRSAGYLFATTAAGMLTGDILIGRFVSDRLRRALVEPLRFLLAVPYVLFLFHPALAVAAALGFVASIGYAASLPLQERLVDRTSPRIRGQVLGLNSAGVTAMQGVAAVLAGLLTERLAGGPAVAIGVLGCASLVITVALIPGLRRSRPKHIPAAVSEPAAGPGPAGADSAGVSVGSG
jgi:predicted MFS family arabinose efflux permease